MTNSLVRASLAVCCGLASHAGCVYAEPVDSVKAVKLPSVEVSANRASVKTPVAFSNISRKELNKGNDGRDLPYLIQAAPSVVVTGDAGAGIGYSAIRVRGTDASRINVTANGVPINDSESHRVYWVNMPDLVSSVRDVQIQRGAGTSTNGAGAFGASINMVTDAPSIDPYAEAAVSYGSFNSNRQTLRVGSGELGDHWSADVRLSHIGSDGYIDRAFSKLWSYLGQLAYSNGGTDIKLLAFGGKERTYMAWDYATKEEMEKYGRRYNPCGAYTDADGKPAFYPDQCDNFTQHHLQLLLYQRLSDKWRLSAAAHYTKGDGYYEQYKTKRTLVEYGLKPFEGSDGEPVKKSDLIRLKFNDCDFGGAIFTLNYLAGRINATAGGGLNWFRGGHYGEVKWVRNYVGSIDPLQRYYDNIGRKFDSNIYVRADVGISSSLTGYADLQLRNIHYTITGVSDNYDYNTEAMARLDIRRDYTFFNPKLGLTYTEGPHRAFASWSVAHKEPVRDNFTDGDPRHLPSAERLFDYEAGYSFANNIVTAGATLYYMDYHDQLVVTGQLSDTGNPLSINAPRSYRAGIELQGAIKPTRWFGWNLTATLSRSRIKDFTEYIYQDEWTNPIAIDCGDTPIAFSPDFTASNTFDFAWRGAEASLATRFVSAQYMNNARSAEARLPHYCVTDLNLAYTFRNIAGLRELRASIAIYNIFNEKYCNNGYAGAGYTIGADGTPEIYRYAGFAAQATTNVMATVTLRL